MKRFCLLPLICLLIQSSGFSQIQYSFDEEIKFAGYLIDNREYDDALLVLSALGHQHQLNDAQADSLNYFKAWSYYYLKELDSSAFYFEKVSGNSAYYHKSKFFQAYNYAFLENPELAKSILNDINPVSDSLLYQLRQFELAGISLLERKLRSFEEISHGFDYQFYHLSAEQKKLSEHYAYLKSYRNKSPFIAGAMSAVLPGAGKIYAGYKYQGTGVFLQVGTLAALTLESYFRQGSKSPQFIIFGSLFSVFYIGNIWGSTLSVKLNNDARNNNINQSILLDMHIPLRRVFE